MIIQHVSILLGFPKVCEWVCEQVLVGSSGFSWFTMVYDGLLMVYYGLLWFIVGFDGF